MDCAWNLTTHVGKRISLDFTKFYISNDANYQPCNSNYIELSDLQVQVASSRLAGARPIKFCHSSNVPKDFVSDGNFVSIKFYSRQFRDWRKFRVEYKAVTNGKNQHTTYLPKQFNYYLVKLQLNIVSI